MCDSTLSKQSGCDVPLLPSLLTRSIIAVEVWPASNFASVHDKKTLALCILLTYICKYEYNVGPWVSAVLWLLMQMILLSFAFFAALYSPTVMFDSTSERCALVMVISSRVKSCSRLVLFSWCLCVNVLFCICSSHPGSFTFFKGGHHPWSY